MLGENIKKEVVEKYSHISMGERQREIYEEILRGEKNEHNWQKGKTFWTS